MAMVNVRIYFLFFFFFASKLEFFVGSRVFFYEYSTIYVLCRIVE